MSQYIVISVEKINGLENLVKAWNYVGVEVMSRFINKHS